MMFKSIAMMQQSDKMMTKKDMIKMGIGIAIAFGVDFTVSTLISHHLPSARGWKKLMYMLGTMALSMKVGEDCEEYFYVMFDETSAAMKEAKEELDKVAEAKATAE